jgi:ubiquinone/menaquinone biosynthesis C-methylase UbiE
MTTIDYAQVYDKLYLHGYHLNPMSGNHAMPRLLPWCVENLKWETALDVGASNGPAVEWLTAKSKQATGIDISSLAVEQAQAYGRNVIQGSALALPFKDKAFDLVFSSDMMEHLAPEDLGAAIAEQVRVSKRYVAHRIACRPAKIERYNKLAGFNLHASVLSIEEWIEKFKAVGLRLIHHDKTDKEMVIFRKPCRGCRRGE